MFYKSLNKQKKSLSERVGWTDMVTCPEETVNHNENDQDVSVNLQLQLKKRNIYKTFMQSLVGMLISVLSHE